MSTLLLTELICSSAGLIFAFLAFHRKQEASRGFKIGALITTVGLAGHTLMQIYASVGGLSEAALTAHGIVFSNAVACAILIVRLPTSEAGRSATA